MMNRKVAHCFSIDLLYISISRGSNDINIPFATPVEILPVFVEIVINFFCQNHIKTRVKMFNVHTLWFKVSSINKKNAYSLLSYGMTNKLFKSNITTSEKKHFHKKYSTHYKLKVSMWCS